MEGYPVPPNLVQELSLITNDGECCPDTPGPDSGCEAFNGLSLDIQGTACGAFFNLEDPSDDPNLTQLVEDGACCGTPEDKHDCSVLGTCVPVPTGEFNSLAECEAAGCADNTTLSIGDWVCKDPVNFPACQQIENETQLNLAISYASQGLCCQEGFATSEECVANSECSGKPDRPDGPIHDPVRPRPDRPRPGRPRPDKIKPNKIKDPKPMIRMQELAGILKKKK